MTARNNIFSKAVRKEKDTPQQKFPLGTFNGKTLVGLDLTLGELSLDY